MLLVVAKLWQQVIVVAMKFVHSGSAMRGQTFANLPTVKDVLSLDGSISYFVPYCLSHLMFVEIHQGSVYVSVAYFNGEFDSFI